MNNNVEKIVRLVMTWVVIMEFKGSCRTSDMHQRDEKYVAK